MQVQVSGRPISVRPEPRMKMKGIGFANVKNYVLTQHSEKHWATVLSSMTRYDSNLAQEALPVGWYDVQVFARLLRTVDKVCGKGNLDLLQDIGIHEAEQDFSRVLRVFLRVLTPGSIFKAEARLWKHFQDSGRWISTPVVGGVDAALLDWATDEALCKELGGYLVRMVQFTGGKDVRVFHSECKARGGERCMFQYRWR